MILAVAGGVFAQEFSWSGGVDINGKIDFEGYDMFLNKATIGQDGDGTTGGHVDLKYTNGGLTLGMGFAAKWWDADDGEIEDATIGLSAEYAGDNYKLHVEMDLLSSGAWTSEGPTSLWGYYTIMDGALRFDVAYKGGGNGNWAVSDLVLNDFTDLDTLEVDPTNGFANKGKGYGVLDETGAMAPNAGDYFAASGSWNWDRLDGAAGFQFTYTGIEGLSAGVQFPFDFDELDAGGVNSTFGGKFLLQSLWGAKYVTDALGISFMIGFNPKVKSFQKDAELEGVFVDIHFGGSYKLNDAMTVNADVAMESKDDFFVSIGAQFDYDAAPLNAGIKVLFHDLTDNIPGAKYLDQGEYGFDGGRTMELIPYASYWFVEDVLQGAIELNLAFGMGDLKDYAKMSISPSILYKVDPNATIKVGYSVEFGLAENAKKGITNDALLGNSMTLGFSWAF